MEETKEKISVCLTLDENENYVWGCAVAICSLVENYKDNKPIDFFIISKISEKNKEILAHASKIRPDIKTKINFIQNPEEYKKVKLKSREFISEAMFTRLYLTHLLPDNVERCIYMDCDVIVETDISELWNIDLKGKSLGAVEIDYMPEYFKINGFKKYFSSGILLIDLKKWRLNNTSEKVIRACVKNVELFKHPDQDGFNIALKDDYTNIPEKWNWHWCYESKEKAILHGVGEPKIWDPNFSNNKNVFYAIQRFFYYTDKTLLKGKRPLQKGPTTHFMYILNHKYKLRLFTRAENIIDTIKRHLYYHLIWKTTNRKIAI